MLYKSEKELLAELKKGVFQRVYLLYGKDDYLKEQFAGLIREKLVEPAYETFNFERYDGKKLDLDRLYDSVLQLPYLSGNRCILVDDLDPDKMAAADSKRLLQILGEIEEGATLVLLVRQPFSVKKSAKCKNFQAAIEKLGGVLCLDERTDADLVKRIVARCEKGGCTMAPEDARFLLERTSRELLPLYGEVDKLIAYTGGGVIDRTAIEAVTIATVEGESYDLSKAILQGDYKSAMTLLDHLFYLRTPEVNILAALTGAFVDLYRGKVSRHCGVESAQVAADFGYRANLTFRVRNAQRDSGRYSLSALKSALEQLAEADRKLKGSRVEGRLVLEQTVTALFLILQKEGRH